MRILWFNERYFDLALDRVTWQEMINCLNGAGFQATLLTSYRNKPLDFGFSIIYLPCIRAKLLHYLTFNLSASLWLIREVRGASSTVVIVDANSVLITLPLLLLRKWGLFKGKLFLDLRTTPVHTSRTWYHLGEFLVSMAVRIARRCFDGITVITPAMKEYLADRFKLPLAQVGIWTSGVNIAIFDFDAIPKEKIADLRQKLGLGGKFIVMYHGSLATNRGLQEAIRATALASQEIQALQLVFLGEGPARILLEAEAQHLRIPQHVLFLDAVPYEQVPLYVALADAVILPFPDLLQWRLSSPLKLLEALSLGRAAIVTDIEAHRFVLKPEHPCAFFATASEAESLAEAISKAYEALADRSYRRWCQLEGRRLIEARFTWEQQANALVEFCQIKGASREKS